MNGSLGDSLQRWEMFLDDERNENEPALDGGDKP
jgi:hypothetical protein